MLYKTNCSQSLKQTVTELEGAIRHTDSDQYPYFSAEFEALCQYHDVSSSNKREDAIVGTAMPLLAGRSAKPLDASNLQSQVPGALHRLALFSGARTTATATNFAPALGRTFSLSLLEKLVFVDTTSLGQMEFLESEKQSLSKAVTLTSEEISTDQSKVLRQMLAKIALESVALHEELFEPQSLEHIVTVLQMVERQGSCNIVQPLECRLEDSTPNDHYFKVLAEQVLPNFISTLTAISQDPEEDIRSAGLATIKLATVLLRLFVPDKPFDPSLSLVVRRNRYAQRVLELTTKAEAISAFELSFSGQTSNMRYEIVQEDLRGLGSAPPSSSVTRPQDSTISLLQGEFSNLINSVLDRRPEELAANKNDPHAQEMIKLIRENVQQLCRRLSTHYRPYDDITIPVVRFLEILDLGLFLASSQPSNDQILRSVSELTPFLGGRLHPILGLDSPRPSSNSRRAIDIKFHELSSLGMATNTDPTVLESRTGKNSLRQILGQFHFLWKTRLREDQEEEARRSNLYQYRGSWEDEEQVDENELNQLFPTYDGDSTEEGKEPSRFDPKAISLRIASLHGKLFETEDPERALSGLVKESARLLGTLWSESKTPISPMHPKEHLPGVLLLLEDMAVDETQKSTKYNFYTDSNLVEARKLVSLTLSVQSRFVQLQNSWPEHAVLQDVILCCKEIYQFKHSEPVAKFLTKVEKLHGLVHEWQLVASREYSAAPLYDELTNLIISWRRLELSTWAKLLDLEREKAQQDVSSWWFIAYEAIIGAPVQMAELGETDMSGHTQEVITTLEQFFLSTSLGQYSERLRLISNFRSLLLLYAQEHPSLGQLASALQNFFEHYKPFEPLVDKLLAEKRSGLEKDIKEQIQLASWKDTNIVALRASARRSHHKLFKLVRKYREVLSLPVQSTLEQGMSDYNEEPGFAHERADSLSTAVIPVALDLCQKDNSAVWLNRAPRFRNTDSTVNSMTQLCSAMPIEFDIGEDIGGFVGSVIEGINDFKSQTPKTLTEENKDTVQHLKVLKKRFFADTLRQLLEMGIKRNTSTSLLETQVSSAQVLSTTATLDASPVSSNLIKNADSYFHRFLDLLPRARQASKHYSEELSNVEVARGIGSVEYLLFTIRKQRGMLSPSLLDLCAFKFTLTKVSNLSKSGLTSLSKSLKSPADVQDLSKAVSWLAPILGLAGGVVDVHSKFSGINAANISKGLQGWKATFDSLRVSLTSLPVLPSGVSSMQHQKVVEEAQCSFSQLSTDLEKWITARPDLSFALDQINPWINMKTDTAKTNESQMLTLQDFDASLLNAVDKILVGLQKLKDVPPSMSSQGSLIRSDDFFSRAIKAVRSSEITTALESVLDKIHLLQSHPDIPYASALMASVLPIANKYYLICEDLVSRFVTVHRETCKMSYVLAKSFTQLASEGFCQPAEASTGEESKAGNLESGTGLGDGEGAEDISKDVGDDEDLSELAQQQNEEAKEDMDDSGEAVNMDQEEMQGEEGERKENEEEEKDDEDGEEGEDDIDEEVGSVDDLDTSAVDEKMWDGGHDEQQKETENQEGKGASESDEQTAAQEKDKGQEKEKEKDDKDGETKEDEEEEEEEEEEEAPEDEGEAVGREDMDVTDPHAKEEDALDLPDEMQLDGEKGDEGDEGEDDDGMDELSDMGAPPVEEQSEEQEGDKMEDAADMDQPTEEQEGNEDEEGNPEETDANEAVEGEEEENAPGEEEQPEDNEFLPQRDENEAAGENVAPSEAANGGLGAEQDQNKEKGASGDAQQEDGAVDAANDDQQNGAANEGEDSKRSKDAGGSDDKNTEKPEMQAFKKMGDILEQWHRRQKEIMEASKQEDGESQEQPLPQDTDMADADFEHLADQDDVADTQALGQASEEQAKALDQNKGVESEVNPGNNEPLPDVTNDEQEDVPENTLEDEMQLDHEAAPTTEGQTEGAMIPGNSQALERTGDAQGQQEVNEKLDEVDSHLAAIHLSSTLPPLTPRDEAQRLWSHYESATTDLSLSLTEQLRLILAPTLATKLRGDFRTGKRLNIKRIIPYIASQYKRDKIWMRRSIPSKRNYQIMLAVDDSKSMLESGSGQLAFETLALVAKSLSMLEAGDLCVLGFGNEDHVRVAHEFGTPFSSEAGTQVFQHFSYQQTGTNVRKLIADSIALFREARWKRSPGAGGGDLWQLELVISDGICEDHDTIRRLVRQAMEERIMVVFIIVDAVKGSSILDLSQASFEPDVESGTGEMKLKMKRYLEDFPFPYYLVVRDVRELPAVLAMALKQWFAEVVGMSS